MQDKCKLIKKGDIKTFGNNLIDYDKEIHKIGLGIAFTR